MWKKLYCPYRKLSLWVNCQESMRILSFSHWHYTVKTQNIISEYYHSSLHKFKQQKVVKIEWNLHFFYFSNLFHSKNNPFLLLSTLSFLPYWVIELPNDFTLYHPKFVLLPIMSTFKDIIPKTYSGCLKSMHIIPIDKHYKNPL